MKLSLRVSAFVFAFGIVSGPVWAAAPSSTEAAFAAAIPSQWEVALMADLADSPQYSAELASAIRAASQETGVAPDVLWAVAHTETHSRHWNERGRVKRGSAGEVGLMQVKPFWARALKREYGVSLDLYNLTDNVRAGAFILSRGGKDMGRMLGYYNTGKPVAGTRYQRKVMKYLASLDGMTAPPALAAPLPMTITIPHGSPRDAATRLVATSTPNPERVSSAVDLRAVRVMAALHFQPPSHLFTAQRDNFSRRP